jgi:hypothetical protein
VLREYVIATELLILAGYCSTALSRQERTGKQTEKDVEARKEYI